MSDRVQTPLVSVIIPAYGHAKYIQATIESVLHQSLSDLELIVIDDASPDDTWSILSDFHDPRLRLFRNDFNLGAHATINRGLELSRGRYIAILNSDDVYHPDRLRRLVEVAIQGYDFIVTSVVPIDGDGQRIEVPSHPWNHWYHGLKDHLARYGDPVRSLCAGNFTVSTSNFFFKRSILDKVGKFRSYRYVHDYDFALRIAFNFSNRFKVLMNEPLLYYRVHPFNTIQENALAAERERLKLLAWWIPRTVSLRHPKWTLALNQQLLEVSNNIEWILNQNMQALSVKFLQMMQAQCVLRKDLSKKEKQLKATQSRLYRTREELKEMSRTLRTKEKTLKETEKSAQKLQEALQDKECELDAFRKSRCHRLRVAVFKLIHVMGFSKGE